MRTISQLNIQKLKRKIAGNIAWIFGWICLLPLFYLSIHNIISFVFCSSLFYFVVVKELINFVSNIRKIIEFRKTHEKEIENESKLDMNYCEIISSWTMHHIIQNANVLSEYHVTADKDLTYVYQRVAREFLWPFVQQRKMHNLHFINAKVPASKGDYAAFMDLIKLSYEKSFELLLK